MTALLLVMLCQNVKVRGTVTVSGAVTIGVAGGSLHLSTLTNGQLATLTNGQLAVMVN